MTASAHNAYLELFGDEIDQETDGSRPAHNDPLPHPVAGSVRLRVEPRLTADPKRDRPRSTQRPPR